MNTAKLLFLSFALLGTGVISSCNKPADVVQAPQQPVLEPNDPVDPVDPNNGSDKPTKAKLAYTNKTAPLIFEMTSTGCPGCGGWGKPTFTKLSTSYASDVTAIAVHIKYGDPMITTESTAIWDNIEGSRYTPMIFVQDENAVILSGGSISSGSEQNARNLIDAALTKQQPALAANVEKKDGKWHVTYGVKFDAVQPVGEYSIACYLLEDGIEHQQSNYAANPAKHNHVIRASASGVWGDAFTMSDLENNEVSFLNTINIDSKYKAENSYVSVVLWQKVNGRYVAVNGYTLK